MAEYIEREALAKDGWYLQRHVYGDGYAAIEIKQLKDIPAADVALVRHGEWMFEEYPDGYYSTYCSNCESRYEEDIYLRKMWNYCPNCGADMREVGNEPDP